MSPAVGLWNCSKLSTKLDALLRKGILNHWRFKIIELGDVNLPRDEAGWTAPIF